MFKTSESPFLSLPPHLKVKAMAPRVLYNVQCTCNQTKIGSIQRCSFFMIRKVFFSVPFIKLYIKCQMSQMFGTVFRLISSSPIYFIFFHALARDEFQICTPFIIISYILVWTGEGAAPTVSQSNLFGCPGQ